MQQIIVTKPFKFAHGGHTVHEFAASPDPIETTDECASLAIGEKWAKPVKASAPAPTPAPSRAPVPPPAPAPGTTANPAAPENAAIGGAPENK